MEEYFEHYKKYPKSEWDFEQIKTKPTIEPTKVSDFVISGVDQSDLGAIMLENPEYNLWVISPVLTAEDWVTRTETRIELDSVFVETDTGKIGRASCRER